ncbi:MAG: FAD-dependent oxidoreductase [Actinomycetes bacterium]
MGTAQGQGSQQGRHAQGTTADRSAANDSGGHDYDVVVVGSGFGGSVSALRLTEKGYRVAVLEAGRRFDADTLPKTSWNLPAFVWMPALGFKGIQRITWLDDVVVLSGAGVGGGSLVYANTLYEPMPPFYADKQWAHITDWRSELAPYYDQAQRMLGVTTYPHVTASDEAMRDVADEMGMGETWHPTPVGVYFGEAGETVPDPYFGGAGPERTGCVECGACMTGCRFGAKNDLTTNYLYLAERAGSEIVPETTVTGLRPLPEGGYAVETEHTGGPLSRLTGRRTHTYTAGQVVLAAGALGSQTLLHRMKDSGTLPGLSDRLGLLTRTNSEALLGAERPKADGPDYSHGVAITSSFHPDEETHIEPVRYGKGSNAMGLLSTILVDGGGRLPRWAKFVGAAARDPLTFARSLTVRRWSERTVIALVMQTKDNSLTVYMKRTLLGGRRLATKQGHGEPNPTWIPVGHDAVRRLARRIGGEPGGTWADVANIPMTAHFIGGCVIGDSPETGVVDPYQRVHGYPGLHVADGSAISANLGVNPSLTITAQAERAMALWPNRGDADPRPAPGSAYRRVDPVAPKNAAVPAQAPAGLRLTTQREDRGAR